MAGKLSSKDIIRLRKNLAKAVGPAEATTRTARLVRKMAEKEAKRNRISLTVKPTLSTDIEKAYDYEFGIKKGGVTKAVARMRYDPGEPNISAERFPPNIEVEEIVALKKGKDLRPMDYRTGFKGLKRRFPKAAYMSGIRSSGAHQTIADRVLDSGGSYLDEIDPEVKRQIIMLPDAPEPQTRFEKALRRVNATRLRGAMKGVKLRGAGPASVVTAPVEAALTAGLTGGGVTGAAAAGATTAGIGAGITAGLKRAGAAVAARAPLLARVGARAAPPLLIAAGMYDVGRTVYEGYQAYHAHDTAKKNEAAMQEKYGTPEAAARTRRRRKLEKTLRPATEYRDYLKFRTEKI